MASSDKVKVALRVRPLNRREIEMGTKIVVDMDSTQTVLYHPSTGVKETQDKDAPPTKKSPKMFAFDHCFWSIDPNVPKFASQEKVFACLGQDILERAFEGYNACIFAYGQTGSGKSYTMMGTNTEKGIIPRLCDRLFDSIAVNTNSGNSFKVEVSYMEIYNEKVRDLLDPKGGKQHLKVREHTILGPYVDGLSTLAVSCFEDIDGLMLEGNKSRTVAATNMNSESSRSHAVFTIILTQTLTDLASGVSGEKVSKMSLVDLAGSERAQKTGAVGERLKEGSNINKSLTTLGLVISALADSAGKHKNKFVPYRDSVLTWLLKDNLGGNSKTVMVATLSPSADNYEETLSTLRYADRAKRIVNHAVVNEDPNARIIRELREEVEMLRKMLSEAQMNRSPALQERLEESEKLMKSMSKTWEEKLRETEEIHQERHAALEKMGISVQTSGIKVEKNKYYLVNLNADPSLNELLVYYLKEHTLVGRPDACKEQDIQLSGLGIMCEHCIIDIEETTDVFLTPLEGARTCLNGRTITEKTKVKNGDRIVWGNNHFFRINCPKANSPSAETPEQKIDYDFAQTELMMQECGDDPIQEAIEAIEKQHVEDKAEALERQRQMYERQMQMLRNQLMSPSTPSQPYPQFFDPFNKTPLAGTPHSTAMHPKYQMWAQEREKLFKSSLAKLKEEVVKANSLVREANFLAEEMGKGTEFSVTLQIPAANLSPNRKRGAFVSEPAILVKRKGRNSQIWAMEKFENKIIDMRDLYEDRRDKGLPMKDQGPPSKGDPFYESQENHNLIGVANVFLEALFYDVKLDYQVPIISQQGEVAGRLHIELCRVSSTLPDNNSADFDSTDHIDMINNEDTVVVGSNVVCRVSIKEAKGLPPALSNFVFCQYSFWGHPEPIVVPPQVDPDFTSLQRQKNDGMSFRFDHKKEFQIHVTEEFIEHCTEGALSMEVWGHRSTGFVAAMPGWEIDHQAKSRSIMDRWSELTRKMELKTEIHELNDQGEYVAVEVIPKPDVLTGGVFQLRQGHSRRIQVEVKPVQNSGTLPIICESITHVSIGAVCARSKVQKGLDSYQEEDLSRLREKWSMALDKRREYLDEQLHKIMNKEEKTDADIEREKSLVDQWVCLTEERNAVLVPAPGSGIPGAPADWNPPPEMEQHVPVIFLDLNADDMSTPGVKEGLQAAGINSILPKEHGAKFYTLPFVKNDSCAVVSWDSSIHDSVHLNRLTPANERVYLILKVIVRLSHPASMELVLRKRVGINVYKRQSITDRLKKRIGKSDTLCVSAVTYEIVSNIPKASEDLEDRESLAQMAASNNEANAVDGETYIEKYIKGVSAVESILTLDRLRQEVAIKELLAGRGRPLRKSTSVPNIHGMRSDSIQDLSYSAERFGSMPKHISLDSLRRVGNEDTPPRDSVLLPNKPTGPFNLASPKAGASPQPTKLVKPMRTLIEEQSIRESKPLLRNDDDSDEDEFAKLKEAPKEGDTVRDPSQETREDSVESDEFQDFESYQGGQEEHAGQLPHSNTSDSLVDPQAKSYPSSASSSGYGSQAQSSQTLSSEDNNSIKSLEEGEGNNANGDHQRAPAARPTTLDPSQAEKEEPEPLRELQRSDSLLDADIPSGLGTPQLLSPELVHAGKTSEEGESAKPDDTQRPDSNCPKDTAENIQNKDKKKMNVSVDPYSEDMLHELERLEGCDESFNITKSLNNTMNASLNASLNTTQNLTSDGVAGHDELADHFDDDQGKYEEIIKAEVKLRKGGVMEVSRPANLKKLRQTESRTTKASPSPVKATYRPMSMPLDQSLPTSHEDLGSHSPDENNSDNEDAMSMYSFGSRADLHRVGDSPVPVWVQVGEPVIVLSSTGGHKSGTVQFIGPTEFASGTWIGVELDFADGKNDGSVKGVRYFKCKARHGIFVRHEKLMMDKKRRGSSGSTGSLKMKAIATTLRRSTGNLSSASPGSRDVPAFMKPTAASVQKHK